MTNTGSNTVSVFDTTTNSVTGTITVGSGPQGIAFVGQYGYVTNSNSNTVTVINSASNTVVGSSIVVGATPNYAASYDTYVYVTNYRGGNGYGSVSVIDSSNNEVIATITDDSFNGPTGIAFVNHYGYVVNWGSQYAEGTGHTVSVIDTNTNEVVDVITLDSVTGQGPEGIVTYGTYAYTANNWSPGSVTVINTLTNSVSSTISSNNFSYPQAIAIINNRGFVTNNGSNTVSVFNIATNRLQTTFAVSATSGSSPAGIASHAINGTFQGYVANYTTSTVSIISPDSFSYVQLTDSASTLSSPSFIAFPYPVASPTQFSGSQIVNNFGTLREYFNALSWKKASGSNVTGYRLYRNDTLIATLEASTVAYEDHNRNPEQTDTYLIYAVDSDGNTSGPQFVQVSGSS